MVSKITQLTIAACGKALYVVAVNDKRKYDIYKGI